MPSGMLANARTEMIGGRGWRVSGLMCGRAMGAYQWLDRR